MATLLVYIVSLVQKSQVREFEESPAVNFATEIQAYWKHGSCILNSASKIEMKACSLMKSCLIIKLCRAPRGIMGLTVLDDETRYWANSITANI